MLMKDPLGYQDSPQYQMLKKEEEEAATESLWGKEVLKGAHMTIPSIHVGLFVNNIHITYRNVLRHGNQFPHVHHTSGWILDESWIWKCRRRNHPK
jgi:hypothetical protein